MTSIPRLTPDVVREGAIRNGVCIRPVVQKLVDTETGEATLVPIPCQSTLAVSCPSCADKARRLRMQQCREGWHLDQEPPRPEKPEPDTTNGNEDQDDEEPAEEQSRRVRSTRRRDDAPDLPRLPVADRTVGQAFTDAKTGKTWRPSMFVTLTLPSYGRVRSDGAPVDFDGYGYRRAALDALHLSKLWDRFVQNLRRAVGYEVQYFAAVEPQRRLAPHIHVAIRGAIPRKLLKQVVAATYASVWWPAHDESVYAGDRLPAWDDRIRGYVDPDTRRPLPTWEQALDQLDTDEQARPAHVARFGAQVDIQGLIGGSSQADRRIGYLTKYLGKAMSDPLGDVDPDDQTPARRGHVARLHREVRFLPCSPRCANWLRYGVQPQDAMPGLAPGECDAQAHDSEHIGCGGRRVLVSRRWTGKTLTEHRADRIGAVRAVLEAAGVDPDDMDQAATNTGRYAATVMREDGKPRYLWAPLDRDELPSYTRVIAEAVAERQRWRTQYDAAKQRAGPVENPFGNSADQQAA